MQGHIKEKVIDAFSLNTILKKTGFSNKKIDFLNIDIEGADFEALSSLDFNIHRPKLICIEIDEKNVIQSKIYKFLANLNYKKKWSSVSNLSQIFIDEKINF